MNDRASSAGSGFAVRKKKRPFLLFLLALSAFGALIALGRWQLERRTWKNDLIARIERSLSASPAVYDPPAAGREPPGSREFRLVRLQGRFLAEKSAKLFAPTPRALHSATQETSGYFIFTPMDFGKGVVFVNRGFVPASLANSFSKSDDDAEHTVTGLIRASREPGWMTPPPEQEKRVFFAEDIARMAAAVKLDATASIASEYIEADGASNPGGWPKGRDPRELLAIIPNRHLEYALTWFGLAATLAGVFGFYIARKQP